MRNNSRKIFTVGGDLDYYFVTKKRAKGHPVYHARFLSNQAGPRGRLVDMQKSTGQTNLQAAIEQVEAWYEQGQLSSGSDTVQGYISKFWTRESAYVREFDEPDEEGNTFPISESHLSNRTRQAKAFVAWCSDRGIVKLTDITRSVLSEYRDHINATKKSPSTRSDYWRAITVPIERAVSDGKLPVSPVPPVKHTGRRRSAHSTKIKRTAFDTDELVKLFNFQNWDNLRARTGALLALVAGLRRGEVRGLLWTNVHPSAGTVDVVTSYKDDEGLSRPKWFHDRLQVPLPASIVLELEAMAPESGSGFVFTSPVKKGAPVSTKYFFENLRTAGKRADPPMKIDSRQGFHSLRHSSVSVADARLQEERRKALREIAGHSDARTQQGYMHTLKSEETRIAQEWDNFLLEHKLSIHHCPADHPGRIAFNFSRVPPLEESTDQNIIKLS